MATLRITLLAFGVFVALTISEISLRCFIAQRTPAELKRNYPPMFEESAVFPYRLRKSFSGRLTTKEFDTSIRINSQGYRGAEVSPPGERVRVLALGDSFTFGWGVNEEDAYPRRLEAYLRSEFPDQDVEVINGGFAGGYSPDTYYLYLKTEGLETRPDLIIVGFFIGNDIDHPMGMEDEWREVDASGFPLAIRSRYFEVVDNLWVSKMVPLRYRIPVLSRSHVFQAAVDSFARVTSIVAELAKRDQVSETSPFVDERPSIPYIYQEVYPERTEVAVRKVQRLFIEMTRLANERGIPIVFAMLPPREQVHEAPFDKSQGQLDKPQVIFSRFFQEHEIAYIDLLKRFREEGSGKELYYPIDLHWNRDGNALAAELIAEYIKAHYAIAAPSTETPLSAAFKRTRE